MFSVSFEDSNSQMEQESLEESMSFVLLHGTVNIASQHIDESGKRIFLLMMRESSCLLSVYGMD